jgi:hypothetical protein
MRRALLPVIAVGVAISLAACSSSDMPVPASSDSASSSASEKPRNKPKLIADGTPKENLPYFLSIMNTAYESSGDANTTSEDMAAYLINAGFDAASMQISENATALGLVPDAKYVATIFQGECMVGTWGSSMMTPTAMVLPVLPQGGCLLGGTARPYQG